MDDDSNRDIVNAATMVERSPNTMLSAQRKDFDEKNKEESPYPRDFTRWYALDHGRRPRKLTSRRFYVTLGTAVVGLLLSLVSMLPALHRTHQAAPVSKSHSMFNQNCANCHDRMFQPLLRLVGCKQAVSVSDKMCNECHHGAPHHAKQSHEAACVNCHREHQGSEVGVLSSHVANRHCTECHRDLPSHLKPGEATDIHGSITNFNRDHPEFNPSPKGKKDTSKIRFSHQAHLDLELDRLDLKGLGAKLQCVDCHQMDDQRRYPLPIKYENHCARCHQLTVALVGDFTRDLKPAATEFSKTPLPHREPTIVRAVLRDRLVLFAQQNKVVPGDAEPSHAARPLPWKPSSPVRGEDWTWASNHAKRGEEMLFVKFMNKQWTRGEPLTGCAHCHIERDRSDGLPIYHETKIPSRWYKQSVFNHGSHRMMSCVECHDKNAEGVPVAHSKTAEDILLPTLKSCRECHHGKGGARDSCVECHRYHDRLQERSPDGLLKMQAVARKNK